MGHLARLLEEAGIPTVVVASDIFGPRLRALSLPRVLLTPHAMGRPVGPPHDVARQRQILLAALDLLEHADRNGAVVEIGGAYQPRRR